MMGRLAVATLRSRRAGFLGAFVALLCSSALLTACGTLLQTGILGTVATQRYAGTVALVSADQNLHFVKSKGKVKSKPLTEHAWLSSATAERLASVPGGAGAVAELSFPADIVGDAIDPKAQRPSWGHAWSSAQLTPFTLAQGRPPLADDELVIDAALASRLGLVVGSAATIQTPTGQSVYHVVGVTRQSLAGQTALFFNDPRARALAGHPGQVFALGLPQATTAELPALRAALVSTSDKVVTGAGRGLLEFTGAAKAKTTLISLSAVLGGTSLVAALLVVTATFSLSIGQRRREIALLRAIGATPKQVRRMIGGEALFVGALGAAFGCAAGIGLATWLRQRFVSLHAMPSTMALQRGVAPAAVAFVLTVAAGWGAARLCARRTARIHPGHALVEAVVRPARVGPFRLVAGVAAMAGFVALLQVLAVLHTDAAASPVSFVATLLAVGSIALLGPLLSQLATAGVSLPLRILGGRTGRLAAANNRANPHRLASVITPLTLAVAITGPIAFTPTTLEHAASTQRLADLRANAVVVSTGSGLTAQVVSTVQSTPGVSAANVELRSTLRVGQDRYPVSGMTPSDITRTLDLGISSGSVDHLGDDGVALSTAAGGHHHVGVGDRTTLTLGDGTKVSLTVRALYAHRLAFGDVVVSDHLLAAHVDDSVADDVLVRTDNLAAVTAAVGSVGARVVSPGRYSAGLAETQRTSAEIGYLAWGLVLGFAAIAVVNSLAMATSARSREFASLRLVGMQKRQVRQMVSLETAALAGTGLVIGLAIGFSVLSAYSSGMTPGHHPYAPPLAVVAILAVVALLIKAATALPTRLSLSNNPADSLNAEP